MGAKSEYVLAMYDVRGKQEFIFRNPHIKEIVGGSAIIRDIFQDYLYPEAEKYPDSKGIYHGEEDFSEAGLVRHLEEENYIGEVVYEGGGNFLLIFRSAEICRKITYCFTREVMKATGSLKVLCTYIPELNFGDWKKDQDRLYAKHRLNESKESTIRPYASLPIVQREYGSSHPIVDIIPVTYNNGSKVDKEVSLESKAKYEKYEKEKKNQKIDEWTMRLDDIVEERGRDSHLAVIYIDGNNMGVKVQECCKDSKSYEECVKALRMLSDTIQRAYIEERKAEIIAYLEKKYESSKKKTGRLIIGAGDEINIICRASDAFDIARLYLKNLSEDKSGEPYKGHSACAGIAIFHSHAPYADAYKIAEECCESGKSYMKKKKSTNASLMDFQYCQGAIGIDLESIRKDEIEHIISRPWLICGEIEEPDEDKATLEEIGRLWAFLQSLGRSNVKGLAEKAYLGEKDLFMEMERIKAHMSEEKLNALIPYSMSSGKDHSDLYSMRKAFEYVKQLNPKLCRKLIYDMVLMYDLWFKEEEENAKKETD